MRANGWEVTGVDASENTVAELSAATGVRALAGSLPHPALEGEAFDLVTMWQTLEHLPDPLETLRQARRLLRPGGELRVSVPNLASAGFHLFGDNWVGLDVPRHLTHFTPSTLRAMLQAAGFRVRDVRMVAYSNWVRHSARAARESRAGGLWRALAAKPLSRALALASCLAGRADCIAATAVG